VERPLSRVDEPGPVALVGLLCRTAERSAAPAQGLEQLAALAGKRLGLEPRLIGSPAEQPAPAPYERDLADSRGCLLEAGGQLEDALGGARIPVLLAGDSAIALTTVPTLARVRPDVKVLYLDSRGDYATPATGEDYLGAMALSGACGEWDPGLGAQPIDPARVVLCGVADLGEDERELLERSAATVIGSSLETLVFTQNALDAAPVFVHLDLEVLNAIEPDKLFDLLEVVTADCDLVGLELAGFEAPADELERQAAASAVLHVLDPLLDAVTRAAAAQASH